MISSVLIAAVLIGRPVFRRHLKRLEPGCMRFGGRMSWVVRRGALWRLLLLFQANSQESPVTFQASYA